MSADEDTELRDLVAQTLESNGVLGKIRAQLRASVFLALEDQESVKNKTPLQNADLLKFLGTKQGVQVAGLVREFLQFFCLDFTLAVFDPELGCIGKLPARDELMRDLGLDGERDKISNQPLLATICSQRDDAKGLSAGGSKEFKNSPTVGRSDNSPPISTIPIQSSAGVAQTKASSNRLLSFEQDDDSFFDESIARDGKGVAVKSNQHEEKKGELGAKSNQSPAGSGTNSLSGLQSLGSANKPHQTSEVARPSLVNKNSFESTEADMRDDYDYEDDFQGSSVSPPVGQTPRSARSDLDSRDKAASPREEEIIEDISNVDDLLKDESSLNGDLTTDRTVSPTEQSDALDYVEDILRH